MKLNSIASLAALGLLSVCHAQTPFFTEIYLNPPSTDDGKETVEIQGVPGTSMTGYSIIYIEGEANTFKGKVRSVYSLTTATIGTNGLLLIRDAATSFNPAPAAGTNVLVQDFNPDIQNDACTIVLGFGTPPAVDFDLDANDDGVLDSGNIPGITVVDAVSFRGSDSINLPFEYEYASQLGGTDLGGHIGTGAYDGTYTGTPDLLYRVLNAAKTAPAGWVCGDIKNPPVDAFNPQWDVDTATTLPRLASYVPGLTAVAFVASNPGHDLGVKNFGFATAPVATISGNIDFLNTSDSGNAESLSYQLKNGSNVYTGSLGVLDNGTGAYSFTVPSGALNGTYSLYVKGGTFLGNYVTVTLNGSSVSGANLSLANGDVDQDGEVGSTDFDLVVAQFGNTGSADCDNDGEVGASDFDIVVANFGLGDNLP